jgi:hypothetical protein
MSYNTAIRREQGGATLAIGSGGVVNVESGGALQRPFS